MTELKKFNRRNFIKKSALTLWAILLNGFLDVLAKSDTNRSVKMKTGDIKKAAAIWYSQAGNTERERRQTYCQNH